jgi:molecular chaperone DnaK
MVNDSERYAEEDARNRRDVETRNMAENAAYGAEKLVKDNAETISDELKSEVEVKVAAVRSALEGGDIALIESAAAELQTSLQAVGQAVYSQAGAGQEAEAPPDAPEDGDPPEADDEGTVEGEFREV